MCPLLVLRTIGRLFCSKFYWGVCFKSNPNCSYCINIERQKNWQPCIETTIVFLNEINLVDTGLRSDRDKNWFGLYVRTYVWTIDEIQNSNIRFISGRYCTAFAQGNWIHTKHCYYLWIRLTSFTSCDSYTCTLVWSTSHIRMSLPKHPKNIRWFVVQKK